MWVPTGSDPILEGVKEAKTKLQEKERDGRRSRVAKYDWELKRRKDELAPPPSSEYEVTFDVRTGMYIRVPKNGREAAGQKTMAEKIALAKVSEMDKGGESGEEERIVRKLETSPPRLPRKRSRSRSRRRSRSRERKRRRSRSRSRHRSRSRSRERRRSRSRDRRRSRSRSRGRRSRSRDRRGKDRGLDRQSSNPQLNTLQREVL